MELISVLAVILSVVATILAVIFIVPEVLGAYYLMKNAFALSE